MTEAELRTNETITAQVGDEVVAMTTDKVTRTGEDLVVSATSMTLPLRPEAGALINASGLLAEGAPATVVVFDEDGVDIITAAEDDVAIATNGDQSLVVAPLDAHTSFHLGLGEPVAVVLGGEDDAGVINVCSGEPSVWRGVMGGLVVVPVGGLESYALAGTDPEDITVTTHSDIDDELRAARETARSVGLDEGLRQGFERGAQTRVEPSDVEQMIAATHDAAGNELIISAVLNSSIATSASRVAKHGLNYIRTRERKELLRTGMSAAALVVSWVTKRRLAREIEQKRSSVRALAEANDVQLPANF